MKSPAEERFLAHLSIAGEDDCWLWTGATDKRGYGKFGASSRKDDSGVWRYKIVYTHRFAYEMFVGPIPQGLTIDHLCRVTTCCNPRHLEAVTLAVNINRARPCAVVCKSGRHSMKDPTNVIRRYDRPTIEGSCRACNNESQRRRAKAKREAAK